MPFLRRIGIAAVVGASLAAAGALVACVIADPPPDLPPPQRHHPNIVHASVVPPSDRVLTEWPAKFIVPVEVVDPTSPFVYDAFVDYDPITNPTFAVIPQTIDPSKIPATLDGGVMQIEFSIDAPTDTSRCHTIEFLVALGFTPASAHTPDSFGADTVHWFYNPAGDIGACPTYDAGGVDGAFPEAASDAVIVPPKDGGAE